MVAKNSDATSWHELLHQFGPFCTEFCKSTKQSQMHQNCTNAPKHEFRVQWGGSGAFIAKNSDATSWHELLHQFGPFCIEFQSQPNVPKCTKIVRTDQNMSLGSNGVDRVHWLRKIPSRLRATNFCTSSARFAPSFVTPPNGHKCTTIVRNTPKQEFRVQWGGSGSFVDKNSDTTSWHELLHQFGTLCTEFVWQPNGPKCFKII